MNLKEIREIIELITEKGIAEFELERSGVRLKVSRNFASRAGEVVFSAPAAIPATASPAPSPTAAGPRSTLPAAASIAPTGTSSATEPEEDIVVVRSPMVGTFYSAPGLNTPLFVEVGDRVRADLVTSENRIIGSLIVRF